jgi:quinol monooxygenase YgiN
MTEISAKKSYFTLIITAEIQPENHDELLTHFEEITREHSQRPGFVSRAVHTNANKTSFVEYIQWQDRQAYQTMADSDEGREHIQKFLPRSDHRRPTPRPAPATRRGPGPVAVGVAP